MAVNTITGTTGNDLLQGQQLSGTQNLINGLAGNDTLLAASVADSLNGGAGNDSLSFGTGLAVNGAALVGGIGSDSFFANGATLLASSYEGNSGADLFSFTAATNISSVSIRGGEGADTITVQTGVAVTYAGLVATLGQGADIFAVGTGATSTNSQVFGGKDKDTLTLGGTYNGGSIGANEGADRLFLAGAGVTVSNTLIGLGKGHDLITNSGAGTLLSTLGTIVGGKGVDTITLQLSALSNFQIWGDTVAENGDSTIGNQDLITLSGNGIGGAGVFGSVYGGAGNDTISFLNVSAGATGFAPNFFGGQGNDSISIAAGNGSSLKGGAGNDTLIGSFTFTAGGIGSSFNLNGGAGVDQVIVSSTATNLMTASTGAIGGFTLGLFSDAGDNLVLGNFGTNTANYSGVNFLNTGAQVVVTAVGGTNTTGAFVYNVTGGFSSIQSTGLRIGDMNIFEANGDTVVQIFNMVNDANSAIAIGQAVSGLNSAALITFNLSGNLGVINNGTAGFIGKSNVNLTFGIASDAILGRNGFTITVA